jgi:hypothetical protein
MRIGDVSRQRRWSDPVRRRWYAHHRAVRFARRMKTGTYGLADLTDARTGMRAAS